MSKIQQYLDKIKEAVFGEEVRGSIHDAIQAIDERVEVCEGYETRVSQSETNAKTYAASAKTSENNAMAYMNATQQMSVTIVGDLQLQVSEEGILQAVYDDGE